MDNKQQEFLARLRETFRVEAAEHIEAITVGLLALERASSTEYAPLVERIFREAHSLKGAARSVSLATVEAVCIELESLFAAIKREEVALSTRVIEAIRPSLEVLSNLCAQPGDPSSSADQEQEQHAIAALKRIPRSKSDAANGTQCNTASPRLVTSDEPTDPIDAAQPETPAAQGIAGLAARDTVRVSSQKLGAVLLEAEGLIGAKLVASTRAAELRSLATELANRNRQRPCQTAAQCRGQTSATAATEILESEILYSRKLESSLKSLAADAQRDAISLAATTDRLIEDTKQVLMLPCSYLLGTLPMVVRDLARAQGKEADLVVKGEDIEIDRRVLDELKAPLIHLLRNSVDHGIEKPDARRELNKPACGVITVTVRPIEGRRVELTVADDGSGIDANKVRNSATRLGIVAVDEATRLLEPDVINFVFHSGLSTTPMITDLSGLGLGLAIVREKVDKLGGMITVTSKPGVGTAFRMLLPLSLATFRGVLVDAVGQRFMIPTANVVRVSRVKPDDIKSVENRQTVTLGNRAVSLVRLRDVLDLSGPNKRTNGSTRPLVLVRAGDSLVALLVDEVLSEREVMVKTLGSQLVRVRNIAGAAISESGAVVPILNVADLVRSAITAGAPSPMDTDQDSTTDRRARLLIAEDSITARTLLKNILEGAGYEVVACVDGMDALITLKTGDFDLVVSDADMPRMNGFELTSKIRGDKKLGELPVVLVTALGTQKDREYGIEVGANAYIVKSDFDQGNLLEIIGRLL